MAHFVLAAQAQTDLNGIWEYIADDNPFAAEHWIDEMEEKFQALAESPMIGRARDELAPGLRSFPVSRYLIFYRRTQDGIEVARVLYGGRDIPTLFQ